MAVERRYTEKNPPRARAGDNSRRSIGGYAAVFGKESRNLGGFVEVVDPAAFNKSSGDGWPGVMCRYNHDDMALLGTTAAGTLRLAITSVGLDYEVDPPESRADLFELVARGDVRESSFAFRTIEDEWDLTDQGFPRRSLMAAQLVDVAPVNDPAYADATVGLRSLAQHFDAALDEVRRLAEEGELRKFFVRTDQPSRPRQTFGAAARVAVLARETDPYV